MTGEKAREYIKQHHPQLPIVQIVDLVNEAQNDFCQQTHILKATAITTSIAGQRYYNFPTDIIRILKVWVDDVEIPRLQGDPIIEDDEIAGTNELATPTNISNDRYWYESHGRIGIVEKIGPTTEAITRDGKSTKYQSISEVLELRISVIGTPTDMSATGFETATIMNGVIGSWERAILDYVIAQAHLLPTGTPELFQVFDGKYQRAVREAKKIARTRFIDVGRIVPNEY